MTRFQNSVSWTFENLEFNVECNNMRRIWRRGKSGANFSFPSYRNYIFFWGEDFRVHLILMILLTNFFYLVMYVTFPFFGVVPLVSVLLASASGWLFSEYLAGLMLYSLDACSLLSPDTSVCTVWKVSKYGVFSVGLPKNADQKKEQIWKLFTQCCQWQVFCWNFLEIQ